MPSPPNVAGQITITAFTDGRPVHVQTTVRSHQGNLRLLAAAVQVLADEMDRQAAMADGQADPVDRERKFLGPRETTSCGKGE